MAPPVPVLDLLCPTRSPVMRALRQMPGTLLCDNARQLVLSPGQEQAQATALKRKQTSALLMPTTYAQQPRSGILELPRDDSKLALLQGAPQKLFLQLLRKLLLQAAAQMHHRLVAYVQHNFGVLASVDAGRTEEASCSWPKFLV